MWQSNYGRRALASVLWPAWWRSAHLEVPSRNLGWGAFENPRRTFGSVLLQHISGYHWEGKWYLYSLMRKTWTHQCLTGCILGGREFLFWRRKFLFLLWAFLLIILECFKSDDFILLIFPSYSPGQTAVEASSDAHLPKTSYLGTHSQSGFRQRCISAISSVKLHLSESIFEHCLAIVDMHVRVRIFHQYTFS